MKLYIENTGEVFGFESDGSQDFRITPTMRPLTAAETFLHENPPPSPEELAGLELLWVQGQMRRVAEQLLMLADKDPSAEAGTEQDWVNYRIALRAWRVGNADFPSVVARPTAPV